ncbi:MAG: hypothetical protein CMH54_15105 [Myxococcales bacterium]|nr:hypothetical protein [Myxococcales bacterium]
MKMHRKAGLVLFGSLLFIGLFMGTALAAESTEKTAAPTLETIVLVDGSTITGIVTTEDGEAVNIRLVDGTTRSIHKSFIASRKETKKVKVVRGQVWGRNPMRTKYFFTPSAIPLRKGEGYLSLKQLTILEGAFGVTDNLALDLGSFLPGVFMGKDSANVILGVKYARKVAPKVHIGGGVMGIVLPWQGALATPMIGITYGQETGDTQFTLGVGKPFAYNFDKQDGASADLVINLSTMIRVSSAGAIVFENWFFPGTPGLCVDEEPGTDGAGGDLVCDESGWGMLSLHVIGFRKINKNSSWDLGAIYIGGLPTPLPWFEYTWYLGD